MISPRERAMALDVRDLRLVHAVAEYGGLTRAGAVLNLTQSALSHQLADLEWRVGAPVFLRQGRRMTLTPVGERLQEAAGEILQALTRTESELRAVAEEREGVIRLSTECYTCYHWLPPVLREFRRNYPKIELVVVAEATRRPVEALLQGQLDVAIFCSATGRDRRLSVVPLFRDEQVAVVAPTHPWARRPFVSPADFASEHLLMYAIPRPQSTLYTGFFLPARVTPRQVSTFELTEAILELVKADLGVAVMARWAIGPHLAAGTLRAVRLTSEGMTRQWRAAVSHVVPLPPHLESFLQLLRREVSPRTRLPRDQCSVVVGQVKTLPRGNARRRNSSTR